MPNPNDPQPDAERGTKVNEHGAGWVHKGPSFRLYADIGSQAVLVDEYNWTDLDTVEALSTWADVICEQQWIMTRDEQRVVFSSHIRHLYIEDRRKREIDPDVDF